MRRSSFICKPCLWQIRQRILTPRLPSQPCTRLQSTLDNDVLSTKKLPPNPATPDDESRRKKERRRSGSRKAAAPPTASGKAAAVQLPDEELLDYQTIFGRDVTIPLPNHVHEVVFEGADWGKSDGPKPRPDPGIRGGLPPDDTGRARSETQKTSAVRLPHRKERRKSRRASKRSFMATTINQLVYLVHHTPPEDLPRAKKMFFAWKKEFHIIWTSLKKDGLAYRDIHAKIKDNKTLLPPLMACQDPDDMRQQWRTNDPVLRKRAWPAVMLNTLRSAPSRAHEVLEATFDENEVPFYAIWDVFRFLVQTYRLLPPAKKGEMEVVEGPDGFERRLKAGAHISRLVLHILRNSSPRFFRFSQDVLYMVAVTSTPKGLLDVFKEAKRYRQRIGFWTKQQFTSHFAKHVGYKTIALEMLRDLVVNEKLDLSAPHGAALCTSILTYDKNTADDPAHQETRARLFEELLDLGLRPNRITFTTMVRNMCLAKEVDRAWQLFEFMKSSGIEPEDQLYSILINGCKLTGDFEKIIKIANELARNKVQNPVIWTDVIHTIYHAYVQASLESGRTSPKTLSAFPTMLQVYCKYFHREPLQRVLLMFNINAVLRDATGSSDTAQMTQGYWIPRIAPFVEALQPLEPQDRLNPGRLTLAVMLCGYVKSLQSPRDLIIFYSSFRQLLKAGEKTARRIVAQGTEVHDAVLMAITRWPGMLRVALDILNDMLDSHTSGPLADNSREPREPGSPAPIPHPKPSPHTWAALIKGLGLAKQPDRGEHALRAMQHQGGEPNDTHWNTLIAGYARVQDAEGVVSALRRREAAGFPPDEYTLKAFGYLRSPGDAYGHMEDVVAARERALAREEAARDEVLGPKGGLGRWQEEVPEEGGEWDLEDGIGEDDSSIAEEASRRLPLHRGMSRDERRG